MSILLIFPPVAKPCEPPAGIAKLAGALRGHGIACTQLDANLEGLAYLMGRTMHPTDTWGKRAWRNIKTNLAELGSPQLYENPARYQRAVADVNRVVEMAGQEHGLGLSLANYQDKDLSPLKSGDLLQAAENYDKNIFAPYFTERLTGLVATKQPQMLGISLNYLSQAMPTFAMLGFLKDRFPELPVILGGGLVTSWLRNPAWQNPFAGLVDHLIAGPGEEALLKLLSDTEAESYCAPDYDDLPLDDYLAPGLILPYAASSGCYWNKCSFCPEKAEENPYVNLPPEQVLTDLHHLLPKTKPTLLHFLDNAVSPALMQALVAEPLGVPWYGFARVSPRLTDVVFCKGLKRSGCTMLKLGLESGDQGVLDSMRKGIDLAMVSQALTALKEAGIATYVYLLFGTPSENEEQARKTLEFVVRHREAINFLNLAIFNMPLASEEAQELAVRDFYEGDLSLYTDFTHPHGWGRRQIRRFLDQEFKRHPAISPILQNDPPIFTSNHAAFFV